MVSVIRIPPGRLTAHPGVFVPGPSMPTMPPTFRPIGARTRQERGRENDKRRRQSKPYRNWYKLDVWLRRRADQLAREPLCARCLAGDLPRLTPATVANHNPPHRGDWEIFITGPLESLCKTCHDSDAQAEERAAERDASQAKGTRP